MLRPFALALLLTMGLNPIRDGAKPPEAKPGPGAPKCPAEDFRADEGSVCIARRGPNWTYAFAYPGAAARIPALDAWLRRQSKLDDGEMERLVDYAREHPEGRFFHEMVYKVDSDLPELLALSEATAEYGGGAHGWFTFDTLLWDKARNRKLEPEELFSDLPAAQAEIRARLCPVLLEAQRREAARGDGGFFDGPCAKPPYNMTLLAAGRQVTTLKVTFTELGGYAGGTYEVYVPVTGRLRALVAKRFRAAFAVSAAPARACNSNLEDCVVGSPGR